MSRDFFILYIAGGHNAVIYSRGVYGGAIPILYYFSVYITEVV